MADVALGQNCPLPNVSHDIARALTLQRYALVQEALYI